MERLLLTPQEVAETLRISRSMVYDLMAKGELPSIKLGVNRRVSVAALKRWIAEQEGETDDVVIGFEEAVARENARLETRP